MTTSLVTGLNSMQGLVTNAKMNVNPSSNTDFSNVLKANTDKSAGQEPKDNLKMDKPETEVKQDKAPQTDDKQVKAETKENKVDTKEEVKSETKDTKVTDETDVSEEPVEEISDEMMAEIASIVNQMVDTIAEVLEVPVEEVEDAVVSMGIEKMELLNPAVIPEVVVEITDAADTMEIMTDEQMYQDVKELMTEAEDLMDQLSQELEIPVEDLKQQIQDAVSEIKVAAEVPAEKVEKTETTVETTDYAEAAPVIETDTEVKSDKSNLNQNNKDERHESGEHMNQFTQTVTDTIKNAVTEKVDNAPLPYATNAEQIMEQVTDSLKMTMKEDITEMEMQLHPASLGNVRVQVAAKDGVITANFTTQNETVKAALEAQIVELKEQMNEQGLKVAAVEVTVSSHAFERNLNEEGGRNTGDDAEPKKKNRRSITLDGLDDVDSLPEDDEERIVADMMARNGNSVDYLA